MAGTILRLPVSIALAIGMLCAASPAGAATRIGLGDSVMKGATSELRARGFRVNTVESRQFSAAPALIRSLKVAGRLPPNVVIHLGNNGYIEQADCRRAVRMAGNRTVYLVTVEGPPGMAGREQPAAPHLREPVLERLDHRLVLLRREPPVMVLRRVPPHARRQDQVRRVHRPPDLRSTRDLGRTDPGPPTSVARNGTPRTVPRPTRVAYPADMRTDPSKREPGPAPTPSWDNSTLRDRLEERPRPGAAIEALHQLARDRDVTIKTRERSGKHRRRRRWTI